MNTTIDQHSIEPYRQKLEDHPVYSEVNNLPRLRLFMQHHFYSVWDFMSLIKTLQSVIAPTEVPWVPRGDGDVRRFINELVLEEESDQTVDGEHFSSHVELYLSAMREIGADTAPADAFLATVASEGIDAALALPSVPGPSARFTRQTFNFIASGHAHEVAAALALGREHIIPCMFRAILKSIGVSAEQAPIFHYYLNRHIHLDEDFHAPLSLRLLNGLIDGDAERHAQALHAANLAVQERIRFWDSVAEAL